MVDISSIDLLSFVNMRSEPTYKRGHRGTTGDIFGECQYCSHPPTRWETYDQWEFQDPKMEVLYHIFGHILLRYSLT